MAISGMDLENQGITDDERKDILIAWAYRFLSTHHRVEGNSELMAFPSAVDEYRVAAKRLVPDVEDLAEICHEHADIATRSQ